MADFKKALPVLLKDEGGYSNCDEDRGGPTKFGITLKFYQSLDPNATQHDIIELSLSTAASIYQKYFWDKYLYGQIEDQSVATKVMDLSVNCGPHQAHLFVQRAIRAACGLFLATDGIMGEKTIASINSCKPDVLLGCIKAEAASFYRNLAITKPSQALFLSGWLNRCYA